MIYLLWFIVFLSISINVFLIWYVRNLIRDLAFISSNISMLKGEVNIFLEHLSQFLNIEVLSEEPIIKNLRSHTEELMNSIKEFDDVLFLAEEENDTDQ